MVEISKTLQFSETDIIFEMMQDLVFPCSFPISDCSIEDVGGYEGIVENNEFGKTILTEDKVKIKKFKLLRELYELYERKHRK